MIGEKIGGLYSKLEDRFYGVLDFLDSRGVPVYKATDFFDNKGVPAFPLTVAVIVVLLSLFLSLNVASSGINPGIRLSLLDGKGNALEGVTVRVENQDGAKVFGPEAMRSGETVQLKNIPLKTVLKVIALKDGFEKGEATVKVTGETLSVPVRLERIGESSLVGRIRLVDSVTSTPVKEATVSGRWKGKLFFDESDFNGLAELTGIPVGENILLEIRHSNYDDKDSEVSFFTEDVQEIQLNPKPAQFEGKTGLVVSIYGMQTGELLTGASISVFNAETDLLIESDDDVESGIYSTSLPEGTVVKLVVEKEGYITFESKDWEYLTLRGREVSKEIMLEQGGKSLLVSVSESGEPLNAVSNAEAALYNSSGSIIESKKTAFNGIVKFDGLDPNETYYLTVFKETFLPERLTVSLAASEEVYVELRKANVQNSSELTINVMTSSKKPAVNASLKFWELVGEEQFPLGVPAQSTGLDGTHTVSVEAGKTVLVEARKGVEQGEGEIEVGLGKNSLLIELEVPLTAKKIVFLDELGNPLKDENASVLVASKEGGTLFEGPMEKEGYVLFDPLDKKYVQVKVTLSNGKEYSEELMVDGKNEFELKVKARKPTELNPEVKFLGIFDSSGERVEGITRGEEYVLKFETEWVAGEYKGGLHVRLGPDSIKYVDSQYVGVTGFDAVASGHFYGRSYNAFPEPGNEAVDRLNKGEAGQLNKFVELYFKNPRGTKIARIRIKARETLKEKEIELHYRAWAEIEGAFHRTPEDRVLRLDAFNREQSGLYAETLSEKIKVFDSFPSCEEELCVSFNFVDEKENVFSEEEFSAAKGKVYALELSIFSKQEQSAQVKLTTSKQKPRLAFTGSEVSFFQEFIDNNSTSTDLDIKEIGLKRFTETKARAYFKAKEAGSTFIKAQAVTDQETLSEDLHFSIFEEKELAIAVSPETVLVGKDFTVTVTDSDGKMVENAAIKIFSPKGELITTIIGNASPGKGRFGNYNVKNTLGLGRHVIEASAKKFRPASLELMVGREDGLKLEKTVELRIPAGQKSVKKKIAIENTLTEQITNLSFELKKPSTFPHELEIGVSLPVVLEAKRKGAFEVSAKYEGGKEQTVYGEAMLEVSGLVNGDFVVKNSTKVKISYNEKLDPECLEFDREELKEYLIGSEGNSKVIEFLMKNNCGQDLRLNPMVVSRGRADPMIQVGAEGLLLREGQEGKARISVVNKIKRNFFRQEQKKFDVLFSSPQLTKSIPLTVILWDQMFSLDATPQIVLYLTQSTAEEPARAIWPIFITNTGFTDIENIQIAQFSRTAQGVSLRVLPENRFPLLKPGMSMVPHKMLLAESSSNVNRRERAILQVNGVINGRQYTLRNIDVFINISAGLSCLEIYSDEGLRFIAEETGYGASKRTIYLKNKCLEPIRIQDIEPKTIQGNTIAISPIGATLSPGQEAEFELMVEHSQDYMGPAEISVVGLGTMSGKWVKSPALAIRLEIGKTAIACAGAEAGTCLVSGSMKLPICDAEGEKRIFFPKLASNDCTLGYCDAQKLARFLLEKSQSLVRQAKARIGGSDASRFSACNPTKSYCMLSRLGVESESFDVFFSNDSLGREMVRNELRKSGFPEMVGYDVQLGDGRNIGEVAGTGFAKVIMIPSDFSGCGLYRVNLSGAVQVIGKKFNTDNIGIKIEVTGERIGVPECNNRIQNILNFLPKDKGYTYLDSGGSWLGLVEPEDDSLKGIAEDFATGWFGEHDGRVLGSAPNNRMLVNTGKVENDGIMQARISQTEATDSPKTVYVTITNLLNEAKSDKIKEDIANEAGRIMKDLEHSQISEGCISDAEDYFIIKTLSSAGEEKPYIKGPDSVNVSLDWACSDFNALESKDSYESVKLKHYFSGGKETIRGIEAVQLRKKTEGDEIEAIKENEVIPHVRFEFDEKKEKFYYPFQLCLKGNKEMQFSQGEKITLSVQGTKRTSESIKEVKIGVCGITPEKLMVELKDRKAEDKPWYATVGWKGSDEPVPLSAVKETIVSGSAGIWSDKYKGKRQNATLAYGGACYGACVLCNGIKKFGVGWIWGAALECPVTCGTPIVVALGKERGWWSRIGGFFKQEFNDVKNFFSKEADEVLKSTVTAPKETEWESGYDAFVESGYKDLVMAGAIAGSTSASLRALITKPPFDTKTAGDYTKALGEFSKDVKATKGVRFPTGYRTATFDGEKITFLDNTGNVVRSVEEQTVKSLQEEVKRANDAFSGSFRRGVSAAERAALKADLTNKEMALRNAESNLRSFNSGRTAASKLNKLKQRGLVDAADIEGAKRAEIVKAAQANTKTRIEQMYKELQKVKVDDQTAFKRTLDEMDTILKRPTTTAADLTELELKAQRLNSLIEGSKKVLVSNIEDKAGRWRRFWARHPKVSTLARGLTCTITSQAAGSLAFAASWGASGALGALDEVKGGKIVDGECEDDPDFAFHKNQTYRVNIGEDSTGKRTIMICPVEELNEVDNSRRLDKCDGKFLKTKSPSSESAEAKSVKGIIEKVAAEKGVDAKLVKAIVQRESRNNPDTVGVDGYPGLMQVAPYHFCNSGYETVQEKAQPNAECFAYSKTGETSIQTGTKVLNSIKTIPAGTKRGIPPSEYFDPETNIGVGVDVFKSVYDNPKIASCSNRTALALAAYNGGLGAVNSGCEIVYRDAEDYSTSVMGIYNGLKGA